MDRSAVLTAMRREGARIADALAGLDEADFDRPTRCEPWTVRELLAHLLVACDRLPAMLAAEGPPRRAEVPAWGYFRHDERFSEPANASRVEAARRDAAAFPAGGALAGAVAAAVADMADRAGGESGDKVVATRWGDAMRLDDFLATRVLELVVHGIDLARALDRPPWTSSEAATVTMDVLVEGAAREALDRTGWDAVELIERATGRLPVSDHDRRLAALRTLALG